MGGGLLQLVAYGAQDAYITGNPHITFWKVMYKRHTNFAMEAMRVNFTGTAQYGQRVVSIVNRNADLIYRTYLEVTLPDTSAAANGISRDVNWTPGGMRRLGWLLLEKVEVEIGGQIIDRHYGEWWYLWECLTASMNQVSKADTMLGGPVGEVALEADASLTKVLPLIARIDDPLLLGTFAPLLDIDTTALGVGLALQPEEGVFYVVILGGVGP